ncbi:CinA family protein [Halomonas sp. 707D4]|nr:CinA family protein [Halomonas sp. 707D4]
MRFVFPGDRQAVREQAVREALVALVLHLSRAPDGGDE